MWGDQGLKGADVKGFAQHRRERLSGAEHRVLWGQRGHQHQWQVGPQPPRQINPGLGPAQLDVG